MNQPVPLVDLRAQMAEVKDAVGADILQALETAGFIGGPQVSAFEAEYADYVGVKHCVGVGNGTDAVEFALRALGVDRDDEVIVPANTFIATAEAVRRAGATPVFVDVDDESLLVSPLEVSKALTRRTKAIVPVHLYGRLADVEAIAHVAPGIPVVEDAAQSQGARRDGRVSGSFGRVAATSFYPGKNLGAAGDAGAVTTDDDEMARRLRSLTNHGSAKKYAHDELGFNSRLDAVQAIALRHKLRRLDAWNAARRSIAERYHEMLSGVEDVRLPETGVGDAHVWHLYVVRVPHRDTVLERLNAAGIGAALHYPVPVHLTAPFAACADGPGSFPVAEQAAGEILSLPMYPHLTPAQQEQVVDALVAALAS